LNRHRQFTSGPVIDNATLRREIEAALLLVLSPPFKFAVAENLEIDETQADHQKPKA
jgi:hypothetical protein